MLYFMPLPLPLIAFRRLLKDLSFLISYENKLAQLI
jgi:hypothetical protein